MFILILLAIVSLSLVCGQVPASAPDLSDFDWKAYLEMNPDLPANGITTKTLAIKHYSDFGMKEERYGPKLKAIEPSYSKALDELNAFTTRFSYKKKEEKSIFVYHLGMIDIRNSIEVIINNLKIFKNAMDLDDPAHSGVFYWINVILNDNNENVLQRYIEDNSNNTMHNRAIIHWNRIPSDIYLHLRTMQYLKPIIDEHFGSLFFINNGVRGPITTGNNLNTLLHNGNYIHVYRKPLYPELYKDAATKYPFLQEYTHRSTKDYNIGMIGSTMSCEISPHVQTHFFGLKSALIATLLAFYEDFYVFKTWPQLIRHYEVDLTQVIIRAGYNVTTMLYVHSMDQPAFNGQCIKSPEKNFIFHAPSHIKPRVNTHFEKIDYTVQNPSRWCDLPVDKLVFIKWGGDMLRTNGFICEIMRATMQLLLMYTSVQNQRLQLQVPETLRGGSLFSMFKQYEDEMYRGFNTSALVTTHGSKSPSSLEEIQLKGNNLPRPSKYAAESVVTSAGANQDGGKVCFLVRTASVHDVNENADLLRQDTFQGYDHLVQSLLRQTDDQWLAFFFITDDKPYTSRLKEILANYKDNRLIFMHINKQFRKAFTKEDAGYTTTDAATRKIFSRKECALISYTNADNIYGSEVVERVRYSLYNSNSIYTKPTNNVVQIQGQRQNLRPGRPQPVTDMILNPLNSRNFIAQDLENRKLDKQWTQYCSALQSLLEISAIELTVQPRPVVGRVDLAGVFFRRDKLEQENIFFGNFTNPIKYPCVGCQDGYFTEYLTLNKQWKYTTLPADGLRSLVFHGPSPLWCIASGNVWFDYAELNKKQCLSHRTVDLIRLRDGRQGDKPGVMDWYHYDTTDKNCLRLSEYGYINRPM